MAGDPRTRVARVLLVLAAVAAAVAVWAFLTGGFRFKVFGIPISARGEHRAALIALVLGAIGLFLHKPLQRRAAIAVTHLPLARLPDVITVLAAVTLLAVGIRYGSQSTGGSDVYGYISQAELWREGRLTIPQDFVASMPWPNADWTFTPLGYRPHHSIEYLMVPTYAPGLPLLMVVFSAIFGAAGPYLVSPVSAAALVLLTYVLGRRISTPTVGAIAAVSIAVSPAVLFIMMLPMSDVPVATLWTASLVLAVRVFRSQGRTAIWAAVAAGLTAGMAIVVRPNLVPLAVVPFVLCAWPAGGRTPGAAPGRAAAFAVASAPAAIFIAWLFNHLYGSPLRSGYGDNDALFGWDNVVQNIWKYPGWFLETQGILVFLFPLGLLLAWRRPDDRLIRAALVTFVGIAFVFYLAYLSFDAWWYLRFLLPVYPIVFVLAADAVQEISRRFGTPARTIALTLFVIGTVGYSAADAAQRGVLVVGSGERKYADVGRYARRTLPANAVVITMQHSGTVRYYARRLTMRYDYLPEDWLDRAVDHLVRAGYEPYLLLDDWEVPIFREKFARQKAVEFAQEPPWRPCTHATFIFRMRVNDAGSRWSERIPQLSGCQ